MKAIGLSGLSERLRLKFPVRVLTVELTNSCNLHCPLCSTGSQYNKKPKGMMKFEHFYKFMHESAFLFDTVSIVGSGEPFLHPECLKFIQYISKDEKKEVNCCSNGTNLVDSEGIVKSGLHSIYIDVDGLNQKQHEIYRRGSHLNKIILNIEKLVETKKSLRAQYPKIFFDTIISKHNEYSYYDFVRLAKRTGVDGIKFRVIVDDIYKTEDWFPVQKKFKPVPRLSGHYDCVFKRSIIGILSWDGEVQLCCMSPNHPEPLIKINAFNTDNLLAEFDSPEFYALSNRAGEYDFCKTCSFNKYSLYSDFVIFDPSICRLLKRQPLRFIDFLKKLIKSFADPSDGQ